MIAQGLTIQSLDQAGLPVVGHFDQGPARPQLDPSHPARLQPADRVQKLQQVGLGDLS